MYESSSNTRQMMANRAVDVGTTEAFKLRSMGLVQFEGNKVVPLCKLYRQCFCVGVACRRHRLGIKNQKSTLGVQ